MLEKSVSQQMAEFGAGLKYEDIPQGVVEKAKLLILDVLGQMACARHLPSSEAMVETLKVLGGSPVSTVIGWKMKTSPQMAALANGTFGHSFDNDDDHRKGVQHPSVVNFPAVFAMAEQSGSTGKDVLTAFIYGSEVSTRVGEAFLGQTYYQGFHATGICGVFGAAAGAAKILDLDTQEISYAFGLAGSQAAGLLEWKAQGTWTKRFQAGQPGMGGVVSALLASNGFNAPTTIWDGEDGFIRAYSYQDQYDLSLILDGLGAKWEMADTSIKVHACCRFTAAVADCGLELHRLGVDVDQIDTILARLNKVTIYLCCTPAETKYQPVTEVDAQFSVPYDLACPLVKGALSIDDFTEEAIRDPRVLEVAKKVSWVLDPEIEAAYPERFSAAVDVTLMDGTVITHRVDNPKGDVENPLSWDEVAEKFRFTAGKHIAAAEVERIIELVAQLDSLDNVDELAALLA